MAIRVFKWSDAGAPTISRTPGAFLAALKACLIDGYGDTDPVGGWTMPFSDLPNNKAVFRMPTGQGSERFLRVDDSVNNYAQVRGFDDMTDIDTGTGAFNSTLYWHRTAAGGNSSTAQVWVIVSDDAASGFLYFQMLEGPGNGMARNGNHYFFGDLRKAPWDQSVIRSAICGASSTSNTSSSGLETIPLTGLGDSSNYLRGYPANNSVTPIARNMMVMGAYAVATLNGGMQAWNTKGNPRYPVDDLINPELSLYGIAASASADETGFLGWIPGYHPGGKYPGDALMLEEITSPHGYPGTTFLRIPSSSSSMAAGAATGCAYLNLTDPWSDPK